MHNVVHQKKNRVALTGWCPSVVAAATADGISETARVVSERILTLKCWWSGFLFSSMRGRTEKEAEIASAKYLCLRRKSKAKPSWKLCMREFWIKRIYSLFTFFCVSSLLSASFAYYCWRYSVSVWWAVTSWNFTGCKRSSMRWTAQTDKIKVKRKVIICYLSKCSMWKFVARVTATRTKEI